MSYSLGDVLLVPFPFTDQSTVKKRPAIVVSGAFYNQRHRDVIIIAVTSQTSAMLYPDNMVIQGWRQAGLLKPSIVKPILMTLQSNLILRQLGSLVSSDRQALQALITQIVG